MRSFLLVSLLPLARAYLGLGSSFYSPFDNEERELASDNPGGRSQYLQCFPVDAAGDSDAPAEASSSSSSAPRSSGMCDTTALAWDDATAKLIERMGKDNAVEGLLLYQMQGLFIGSVTDLIVEAGDASISGATVADGKEGDTNFPFGDIKVLATMGERSVCPDTLGDPLVGKPDGMGAYIPEAGTLRVVWQSESYGPLTANEAWAYPVNNGRAKIGGSHIQFIDYDRDMFADFMTADYPAANMVKGHGQMIERAHNLKGERLGPRYPGESTPYGAHYSNTDADGKWVEAAEPRITYDWFYQSLCSAHMEMHHQWGDGQGFEDDIFITNEEWDNFIDGEMFVGNSYHALDMKNKALWAIGAMSLGGFEKAAEIRPMSDRHVIVAIAGYNGAFNGHSAILEARREEYGLRPDGSNYTWTNDVHPYRVYVGVKGVNEKGEPDDSFLGRNGLKYGKIYGFAIDMTENGPTGGVWRDPFHKNSTAFNGAAVPGKWVASEWQWDGVVRNFQHDGSWDWQLPVPGEGMEDYMWWNANGYDEKGAKMEHLSPDVREGITGFVQGSTAGYFGHCYMDGVEDALGAVSGTDLPASFDGSYYVYQGELDITEQVKLGGKGQLPNGADATRNWDSTDGEGKVTFEDIDGFEVIFAADGAYAVIQEDSGNKYGERCLISSALEHEDDGVELDYYFVAMSGGAENTRNAAGVGIPEGTNPRAGGHEFSGVFDLSGLVHKQPNGQYMVKPDSPGYVKRMADSMININDKQIMLNVQASNFNGGLIEVFGADTGGQILMYQPQI